MDGNGNGSFQEVDDFADLFSGSDPAPGAADEVNPDDFADLTSPSASAPAGDPFPADEAPADAPADIEEFVLEGPATEAESQEAAPAAPQVPPADAAPVAPPASAPVAAVAPDLTMTLVESLAQLTREMSKMSERMEAYERGSAPADSDLLALPPASTESPVAEVQPVVETAPEPASALEMPADDPFAAEPALEGLGAEDDLFGGDAAAEQTTPEPADDPFAPEGPLLTEEPVVSEAAQVVSAERIEAARRLAAERAEAQRLQILNAAIEKFERGDALTLVEKEILANEGIDTEPEIIAPVSPGLVELPPARIAEPAETYPVHQEPASYQDAGLPEFDEPGVWSPEDGTGEADLIDAAPSYADPAEVAPAFEEPAYDAPQAPVDDEAWMEDDNSFAHLDGPQDIAPQSYAADADLIPVDALWAVGVRDSDAEETLRSTQAFDRMRSEARESSRRDKGRSGGRVKLPRLEFSAIEENDPLVIAVFSPKGGAGKSTTSVNLSALMAASGAAAAGKGQPAPRVLVLDGDIANGNLAIRVANKLDPNLLELIMWMDRNGEPQAYLPEEAGGGAGMQEFVLYHNDLPNLNILAAPDNAEAFDDFTVEDYERIIKLLGRFYDVIVIDCGTEIVMQSNQTWLRHAHQVFLLTLPERAALHSAGKVARLITRPSANGERPMLVSPDKLHVVMMRSDADLGFDPRIGMEETFPWADSAHTTYFRDYDRETARANNAGQFLSLENADYAQDIGQLALAAFRHYRESRRPGSRQ